MIAKQWEGTARLETIALILMIVIGMMWAGCALFVVGAAAGAAGVAYIEGDLQAHLKADPRAIEKASLKAFEVMGITRISGSSSALDSEAIGRTADDTKVAIKSKIETSGESSLSIRIGTFGDEAMSRRILDEIEKQLPDAVRELEMELKDKQT